MDQRIETFSEKPLSNLRCFVSGWGKNDFNYGSNQAIQRRVDVPLWNNDKCQATLRLTKLGSNFVLDPGFMCAGNERSDVRLRILHPTELSQILCNTSQVVKEAKMHALAMEVIRT